ncbi:hypothetical protein JQV19_08415 [Sulfitobacter mediterraneus]|uniref:phage adaptor protein n=1 Tax=Sulfitobacter mediterraneus TaxID=83219 RepID=UPI00193A345A|nr:hypothetical protein [Sulfitobacter mediterraneus]MBM1556669.1 hypothetical protein [Sulfitobacter mediterraneus]MBM1570134.1 hypothetical protein [Sulfitobacter mediterraneus]MBM1574091.1 hypothetical protein [Sulfitobacter mediterraneus]MBM1577876.1 hypothetical protein [Sulfitobacter mediterraneus]MBM1579627.1 hypothetical protein [Sulfitobacter mediterraneus]
MSISDYTELLIEASERGGDPTLPTRGKMLVGLVENHLNKKLRVSDMEASTTVTTDANGEATIPSGWVGLEGVYYDDVRVPRLMYSPVEQDFVSWGYYTSGDTIKSNLKSRSIVIRYYSAIPSLHTNSTNWLLTAEPEIYLTGLAWQMALRSNDFEKAALAKGYLDSLLGDFRKDDSAKRRGMTSVDMGGGTFDRGSNFTVTAS